MRGPDEQQYSVPDQQAGTADLRSSASTEYDACRSRPQCPQNHDQAAFIPAAGPNQVVSAATSSCVVASPTQATCPSGRINTAAGAATSPITGSSTEPLY